MFSIFDVEWERVELSHLRAFLAEADEEGLTWEAKADEPRADGKRLHPGQIRRSACAFANQVGGFVVLGARKEEGRWQLPGIATPEEAGLWLDQVLSGLRPLPRYQHKTWKLEEGRVAAVIRVEPLTATPCMTKDGQVFERTSSESVQVKDPTRLHELITRGQQAQARAEAFAARAAEVYSGREGPFADYTVRVSIGLAATSYEPDISSRLFHSRFPRELDERMQARLFTDFGQEREGEPRRLIQQSFMECALDAVMLHWVVRANWDGSLAVLAAIRPEYAAVFSVMDFAIWPAWKLAAEVVELLGGYGDARMCLLITVRNQSVNLPGRTIPALGPDTLYGRLRPETRIERQAAVAHPLDAEIGSVQRELQRAAGYWSHEGVPDPPQ